MKLRIRHVVRQPKQWVYGGPVAWQEVGPWSGVLLALGFL